MFKAIITTIFLASSATGDKIAFIIRPSILRCNAGNVNYNTFCLPYPSDYVSTRPCSRGYSSITSMKQSTASTPGGVIDDMDAEEELNIVAPITNIEKAWRYSKKPLLSIGSKGASPSHGNSLRQLLEQHEVVKVKVSTRKHGTLTEAFDVLRLLAEGKGAPEGYELLKIRDNENIILFGRPGIGKEIERGSFPPPPPPPYIPKVYGADDE